MTFKELAAKLPGVSVSTLSQIARDHGIHRKPRLMANLDLSLLDEELDVQAPFTPESVAEIIGKDADAKEWVQGFMEPKLEVEDYEFHEGLAQVEAQEGE